jgi:hypothetical protein
MSHTITTRVISVILSVLCPSGSLAAAVIRFIPLNDEVAACSIALQDAERMTTLKDLNSQKRSKPYNCKIGKAPLRLVTKDRKGADGKPASAAILLPPEFKSPLVLLLSDPRHPSGIRALAIEDSSAGFAWGCLRFLNLTESPLMIRHGTVVESLPDGETPLDLVPGGEARNFGVQLFKEKEPSKVLYSAVWEHDPNFRTLIVIVPGADPKMKALDLSIIPEDRRLKK